MINRAKRSDRVVGAVMAAAGEGMKVEEVTTTTTDVTTTKEIARETITEGMTIDEMIMITIKGITTMMVMEGVEVRCCPLALFQSHTCAHSSVGVQTLL